jgi:hypothetical protein
MNRSELKKLSRRELYEMSKAYDVPGRSRMTKDELVEALSRVSARKVMPKPKAPKRRMSKRRVRRRKVMVHAVAPRSGRDAGSSRVAPAAPPAQPQVYIDRGPELPWQYGQDKVFAMVRDPNWLYVYWDLSGGARERVSRKAPSGVWVLRVHNLSAGTFDDVPILIEGGNWYLPVAADTEYRVDIGIVGPDGAFHLAASSRRIKTPRMGISELVDEEWLILEDEFQRLMEMSDGFALRFSGSRFLSEVITGRHRAGGLHSAGISSIGGSRRK